MGLIALAGVDALASDPPSQPVCRSAPDCNVAGTRALESGRMDAASAAFKAEAGFAWCAGDTAQLALAHNNLALLALRRDEPLGARMWAGVALRFDPKSRAGLYNARVADERVARLPIAQGVTGTYEYYWGEPEGNLVSIEELPGKRVRFELWATHAFSCHDMEPGPQGGATGVTVLNGRDAVWESREFTENVCRLRFSFGPDELLVTQEGSAMDCGFGNGVYADGTYRRTSRQPPRFTPTRDKD
jgi:hypothetical protein